MKLLSSSFLGRFICLILLWLPIWLALWYLAAGLLSAPAVWLSVLVINLLENGLIDDILRSGHQFTLVTEIMVQMPDAPTRGTGQIMVEKNPLLYTWNLPVLMAMLFATDDSFFSLKKLFNTYLLLLPFQAWGIGFDIVKTLAFEAGPEVQSELSYGFWQQQFIAIGYQFGYLLLPFVSAAAIWILMNRDFLDKRFQLPH